MLNVFSRCVVKVFANVWLGLKQHIVSDAVGQWLQHVSIQKVIIASTAVKKLQS